MKTLNFIQTPLLLPSTDTEAERAPKPRMEDYDPAAGLLIVGRTVYAQISGRSYERILRGLRARGARFHAVSFNTNDGAFCFNLISRG